MAGPVEPENEGFGVRVLIDEKSDFFFARSCSPEWISLQSRFRKKDFIHTY